MPLSQLNDPCPGSYDYHFYFNLEPIGSSIPKIADNDIKRSYEGISNQLSLTCEGQAFPPPNFRYLLFSKGQNTAQV